MLKKTDDNCEIENDYIDDEEYSEKRKQKLLEWAKRDRERASQRSSLYHERVECGNTTYIDGKINLMYFCEDDSFYDNHEFDLNSLIESILEEGLINPIAVWNTIESKAEQYEVYGKGEGKLYMIVDGYKRVKAYRKLYELTGDEKYLTIPYRVYEKIDIERARLIRKINNTRY